MYFTAVYLYIFILISNLFTLKRFIMKKLIVFLFFGLFIAMIISSCSKDDIIVSSNNDKPLSGKIGLTQNGSFDLTKFNNTNTNSRMPDMRMLYCEWGWYWGDDGLEWTILWCSCIGIPVNCLPDVVITPYMSAYNNFKDHFDNGTLEQYFSTDDYKSIFPGLEDLGVVGKLQNGEISLYLYPDTVMKKDFYIGLPQGVVFSSTDTSWMSNTECVLVTSYE